MFLALEKTISIAKSAFLWLRLDQWCPGSLRSENPWFAAFADFQGMNAPTTANLKQPKQTTDFQNSWMFNNFLL